MDLYDLAARQHGVISRSQLHDLGITEAKLRTLLRRGTVERTLPATYRVRGTEAGWLQRLSAATLWVPGSQASHRAAAMLRGLRGVEQAPVEVSTERWTRPPRQRGIIVHETKDLTPNDHSEHRLIACTSLVRTLVDLPAVVPKARAGDALDSAARRRPDLLDLVAQRHREVARQGRTGVVALRELLAERGQGNVAVDSGFERQMVLLLAASGLPPAETQVRVHAPGFDAYLDVAWPRFKVAVECDSVEFHLNERAFRWERRRRRQLELLGWDTYEYTFHELKREPDMIVDQLRQALEIAAHRSPRPLLP